MTQETCHDHMNHDTPYDPSCSLCTGVLTPDPWILVNGLLVKNLLYAERET